jgi:hypothetical protein
MNLSAVWKSSYGNSPSYEMVDLNQSRKAQLGGEAVILNANEPRWRSQPSLNGTLRVANLGAVPD